MSKETRRDIVLIVIFAVVSAIGVASVFLDCRFLAWIVVRWNGSLFIRQNAAGCPLHQLLYISPDRLLAKTGLWSTCSARPARQ